MLSFYSKEVRGHILNPRIYRSRTFFFLGTQQARSLLSFPTLGPERKRSLSKVTQQISATGKKERLHLLGCAVFLPGGAASAEPLIRVTDPFSFHFEPKSRALCLIKETTADRE